MPGVGARQRHRGGARAACELAVQLSHAQRNRRGLHLRAIGLRDVDQLGKLTRGHPRRGRVDDLQRTLLRQRQQLAKLRLDLLDGGLRGDELLLRTRKLRPRLHHVKVRDHARFLERLRIAHVLGERRHLRRRHARKLHRAEHAVACRARALRDREPGDVRAGAGDVDALTSDVLAKAGAPTRVKRLHCRDRRLILLIGGDLEGRGLLTLRPRQRYLAHRPHEDGAAGEINRQLIGRVRLPQPPLRLRNRLFLNAHLRVALGRPLRSGLRRQNDLACVAEAHVRREPDRLRCVGRSRRIGHRFRIRHGSGIGSLCMHRQGHGRSQRCPQHGSPEYSHHPRRA